MPSSSGPTRSPRSGPPTPAQMRGLRRRDPLLARAMGQVAPFPEFPIRADSDSHFHSLAKAIVHQQLSTKAAGTIHGRVRRLSPGRRFPTPPQILKLPDAHLRGAGLSRAKTIAIKDLAAKTLDGSLGLRTIARRPDEEVIEILTRVRGIGVWSAQMFLLFRLGRQDVMAGGDLGLQEGLRILDGLPERPGPKELEERAEVWAPLRSVASWVLWRLVSA
ncbi:MAG: DNA-3-methyladenine glycosylase 2 family protein [bacterium]